MRIALLVLATMVLAFASANSAMLATNAPQPSAGIRQASSEPTPFCKGYKDGFRRGYCGTVMPCGRAGERSWCRSSYYLPQTYEAGYARGLEDGEAARRQAVEAPRGPPPPPDESERWKQGTCDVCVPQPPPPSEGPQPQPQPTPPPEPPAPPSEPPAPPIHDDRRDGDGPRPSPHP
jgi:hypothetical protein